MGSSREERTRQTGGQRKEHSLEELKRQGISNGLNETNNADKKTTLPRDGHAEPRVLSVPYFRNKKNARKPLAQEQYSRMGKGLNLATEGRGKKVKLQRKPDPTNRRLNLGGRTFTQEGYEFHRRPAVSNC